MDIATCVRPNTAETNYLSRACKMFTDLLCSFYSADTYVLGAIQMFHDDNNDDDNDDDFAKFLACDIFLVRIHLRHRYSSLFSSLVLGANRFQTCSSCLQVSALRGTVEPFRRI